MAWLTVVGCSPYRSDVQDPWDDPAIRSCMMEGTSVYPYIHMVGYNSKYIFNSIDSFKEKILGKSLFHMKIDGFL